MADDRPDLRFNPDKTITVHAEGAIRLICAQFRSHEDGLPEWVKNSSDAHARLNLSPEESVIVLLFRDAEGGAIGCLDFGGMTTADIEAKFRNWADPEAAGGTNGPTIEGGHGNGGKCYMTQLFGSHSYIHTLRGGRGNKYGFVSGSFVPGYFAAGRGYVVERPDAELDEALSVFDLKWERLPQLCQSAWRRRQSFTLVVGFRPKHVHRRLPVTRWIEALQGHQQMVRAIQYNRIFVLHNGRIAPEAAPFGLPEISPIPGHEAPREIIVPKVVIDPTTGEPVDTTADEDQGKLVLRTSSVSMRWSLKARHTINGWAGGRATGYWGVQDLSRAAYANRIYGDLYLDALYGYKQNDRRRHTESPLVRALTEWLREQIDSYSEEFVKLDRLQTSQEEKDQLKRINDALNRWKNKFLEHEFGGSGDAARKGDGPIKERPRLPRGEPAQVVLALSHNAAGQGVSLRPSLDFLASDGSRVRAVPYSWESSDWAVATIDDELNMITTHGPGKTELCAICDDSGLRSNKVELEVLDIVEIALEPKNIEIMVGGKSAIVARVRTRDNSSRDGVYLIWTESNSDVVSVGSSGMVFGLQPGSATVSAGDDQTMAEAGSSVTVLERSSDGKRGGGYPLILLSEIDDDPFGEGPPALSASDPPVHQRLQDVDNNVWWINMASPLARRYLDAARGGGPRTKEWRIYHLERYIEIMVKVLLNYDFLHGEELTFDRVMRRWDEEATAMQERVATLLEAFLEEGDLSELET